MQSNAVDGTLSEVLQLPVTSWKLVNSLNPLRGRRQVIFQYYTISVLLIFLILITQNTKISYCC